jgi:hypothetical protein
LKSSSSEVEAGAASAKPFEAGLALDLNLVGLRDRIKM